MLTVSEIGYTTDSTWTRVYLQKDSPALDAFTATAQFSYVETEISTLQAIHIELLDASGNVIFYSAYCDCWTGSGGAQFDGIGNSSVPPPGSDWPLQATSGSVAIEIARDAGGLGTIKWNNGIVLSAMETTPVTAVRLGCFHFPMT